MESSNNNSRVRIASRFRAVCSVSALALLGLIAATPLNMGGCTVDQIRTGLSAGGEAIEGSTLSEADELPLGESAACAITTRYPIWKNDAANRYVNLVGMTVASGCDRPDIAFSFAVLDTNEVNAFSAPGGFVMITRGALLRITDESELAGVLGHEIGHVVLKHGMAATSRAMQSEAGRKALKALSGSNARVQQFGFAADTVTDTVLSKGWDQPEEFAADEQAVKLVIRANYDPAGFERFLGKLQSSGGSLMSTHPSQAERLARITKQIDAAGARGRGQTLAERFAANIKTR
jgi:predicted Zn-dependent protease